MLTIYFNLKSEPIPNYTRCIKEKKFLQFIKNKMGFDDDVLSDGHNYNNSRRNMRGKTSQERS